MIEENHGATAHRFQFRRRRRRRSPEPANRWLTLLPSFSLFGLIALVIYSAALHSWAVMGYGVVVSVSSTLVGGLIGVLFGIPRSAEGSQSPPPGSGYIGNTNLEQVSDWLTKILVGVGLVQLGHAPAAMGRLADDMKSGFGASTSSASFGLALALTFTIAGFIYFYLWSRIFLSKDLPRDGARDGEVQNPTPSVGQVANSGVDPQKPPVQSS